jgi:hypothetical protein
MASLAAPVAPPAPRPPRADPALRVVAGADVAPVFAHEPDLLTGLDPASCDLLRRRAHAPKLWLEPGPWRPPVRGAEGGPALGLLVLDGLLLRTVRLQDRDCPELLGAGDLLRPWDTPEGVSSLAPGTSWEVVVPTTIAVLDGTFAALACRFPAVVDNLLGRAVQRSRLLTLQLAIVHVRRAETRLLMLLWHLADRWGRVTPEGIHLPLPLKHELLAHLTGMRRPTASTALAHLVRTGALARRPDGSWLLLGDPPLSPG